MLPRTSMTFYGTRKSGFIAAIKHMAHYGAATEAALYLQAAQDKQQRPLQHTLWPVLGPTMAESSPSASSVQHMCVIRAIIGMITSESESNSEVVNRRLQHLSRTRARTKTPLSCDSGWNLNLPQLHAVN